MEQHLLTAQTRLIHGRKVRALRRDGKIPCVVYGHGSSESIEVDARSMERLYRSAGESTLIDLTIGDAASAKVLIHEVSVDPLRGNLTHVDFYRVKMDENIEADLHINFVGQAPAVKELGAVLVKQLTNIHVSCLPGDLLSAVDVSLETLVAFHNAIHVRDLALPETISILANPDDIIVMVMPPRVEEEAAPTTETAPEPERVGDAEKKAAEEATATDEKDEKEGKKKKGEGKKKNA